MKRAIGLNMLVFAVLLAIPTVLEAISLASGEQPGSSADALMREPFPLAYPLGAFLLFSSINVFLFRRRLSPAVFGVIVAVPLTLAWLGVSMLVIGRLAAGG